MTELGAVVSGGVTHPPTNTSPVRQPQPETPLAELVRFIERECRQVSVNNGWGQRHARGLADKVLDAIRAEREVASLRADPPQPSDDHAGCYWHRKYDELFADVERTGRRLIERDKAKADPPQDWQPIETAPTYPETPILLWTPHMMAVGTFDNDEWWILGGRGMVIEATHWMPLPKPPVVTDDQTE